MSQIEKILNEIYKNSANVKFTDLCRVCEHYFGKARQSGSSHRIYKTPWQGDPRVNIQNSKGKAKIYQVKQVIKAIEKLEVESDTTK
ncbi:toxin HicA [Desulfobacter hydrogenophilus]|uniref:Toxin HicA n=1 Tax=Desulfobacter hydrogenophilus TaxID=2291 RepID=A0A328FDY4_9BACT|nr:toxin HicA [Desulfobacter hydrogenophilus]NDY74117.1 toxin HicA [Desulfobacter hydrogenophilus]QBH14081.1 toxin HicA [Desulfobacter hydrogenophilus]RAM01642.1 toxin HicA [Desulfobacter hydrogenophilus]